MIRDSNINENCVICGVGSLLFTTIILICGSIISYYTFEIMTMVNYFQLGMACKTSNLWEYLLISCLTLIFLLFIGKAIITKVDLLKKIKKIVFMIPPTLFYLGMVIWGGYELFHKDKLCNNLKNTMFEQMGLANVIMQSILLVFSLLLIMKFYYRN